MGRVGFIDSCDGDVFTHHDLAIKQAAGRRKQRTRLLNQSDVLHCLYVTECSGTGAPYYP